MFLARIGFRYLIRRPLLSILCILGVALGVAVVIAISLANGSASRAFRMSTDTVAGKATHQIVSSSGYVDETVYARLRTELGVEAAAPVIELYSRAAELGNTRMHILGVDVFAEGPFRSYLSGDGATQRNQDLAGLIARADGVVLSAGTAARYGLKLGDPVTFRVGDTERRATLVATVAAADENSSRALEDVAMMDIGAAQSVFGLRGKLSHIDLILDERSAAGSDLAARIRAALPPNLRLERPEARSQSVEGLTDAFELNLTALSLLALVVGVFLIYNTITFSVVQRRPLFGTLRCLGVTRGQIFGMVIGEAVAFGAIGGILGMGFGIVLGRGAVRLVTQTINDLYYVVNVSTVDIDPWVLAKGFALGVVASALAAVAPALEATLIPPVSALKRTRIEQSVRRLLPWLAGAGVATIAAGALALLSSTSLTVNLGGIFGVVVGAALISPLLVVAFMRLIGPALSRVAGAVGRMAARSVSLSLSRTAVAIASLMIAVSVIIGLQSMIASFRRTVDLWLSGTLVADVYLRTSSLDSDRSGGELDAGTIQSVAAQPGVESVVLLRRSETRFKVAGQGDWQSALLLAEESNGDREVSNTKWTDLPGDFRARWTSLRGKDEVFVSEPLANKQGVTPARNIILVDTDSGPREFVVRGVYYDYGADRGTILMRRDLYQRYWNDTAVTSMALYLDPATQPNVRAFVAGLKQTYASQNISFTANSDLRSNALQVFDRTFAITGALNILATIVAFIGVLSALMALLIERTRELGVLRANGMTLPQLSRMVLLESALIGGTAGLLAVPTGLALAWILVYIINLRAFGWTIQLNLQAATFAQAMAVAVASALLAALYPLWRLRHLQIAQAVRLE